MWMKVRRGGLSALLVMTGTSLLHTSTSFAATARPTGRTLNLRVLALAVHSSTALGAEPVAAWIVRGSQAGAFRALHAVATESSALDEASPGAGQVISLRFVMGRDAAVPVITNASTVGDLLLALEVRLRPLDVTKPSRDTALRANSLVQVIRIRESKRTQTQRVPYETLIQYSKEFPQGDVEVLSPGTPGSVRVTYLITRRNGREVSRKVVNRVVLAEPVSQVERHGTVAPPSTPGGVEYGNASWYDWSGCGGYHAAHKTLPFGTVVTVTNLDNGKRIAVTINDRGPYIAGRIIDLCPSAFAAIAPLGQGVAHVRISS
jgi:rare lipoprotein A (peptidoglycan hydrolase)